MSNAANVDDDLEAVATTLKKAEGKFSDVHKRLETVESEVKQLKGVVEEGRAEVGVARTLLQTFANRYSLLNRKGPWGQTTSKPLFQTPAKYAEVQVRDMAWFNPMRPLMWLWCHHEWQTQCAWESWSTPKGEWVSASVRGDGKILGDVEPSLYVGQYQHDPYVRAKFIATVSNDHFLQGITHSGHIYNAPN